MGEQGFDTDKHDITSEHAVLIPALPTVKSLLPYVEAVAIVIGSCHIHSVYEDRDHIKIYLKDKRFVDILVNNGVSVLGRQINVDYAVPRADKIILSNIDPIVPDSILTKLLCYYGNPVSAIIHEKIATNSEYSHIECGKRKVYMKIFPEKKIPNKINFTYQNMLFRIDVLVELSERDVPETMDQEVLPVLTRERSEEETNDELESSINMKPDIEDLELKKQPSEKQLAYRGRGKSKANTAADMAHRLKRRARKGWYGTKNNMAGNKLSQQNKEKLRFARKRLAAEGKKKSKSLGTGLKNESSSRNNSTMEDHPSCSSALDLNDGPDQSSVSVNEIPDDVTQYPLNSNDLMEFIRKTRFQRDPCPIAWEFLEEKTPEAIEALKFQLQEYSHVAKEQPIKLRVRRLIATLKYSKDSSDE